MKFVNMLTKEERFSEPWQDELQPGDCFVNEQPVAGVIEADGTAKQFDTSKWPIIYCEIVKPAHAPGFFWVKAYSAWEPQGEMGVQCILDARRKITREEFTKAVEALQ